MNKNDVIALLGRPLTTVEDTNFDLYINIAKETLQNMICMSLSCDDEPRVYTPREGYKTLFTDVFTDVSEVKIDGVVIDEDKYSVRQWDKRNGSWYNSIVFTDEFTEDDDEVEVSASWGFNKVPNDLKTVWAGLFDLITKKNKFDPTISSKDVEDFRITFNKGIDMDAEFKTKYSTILSKYNMCDIPNIQHGGC